MKILLFMIKSHGCIYATAPEQVRVLKCQASSGESQMTKLQVQGWPSWHCGDITKMFLFMKSENSIFLEGSQCDWQITDEGILCALFPNHNHPLVNS